MCTKADVIFTVSKEFIPDLQPYGKPLLYVPHGIPSDDFMASETPQKIKNLLPKDYILYVGTVDFRLDYQLIDTLLCTFPEMSAPINDLMIVYLESYSKLLFLQTY
jgi:hypothetical protein